MKGIIIAVGIGMAGRSHLTEFIDNQINVNVVVWEEERKGCDVRDYRSSRE